MNQNSNRVRTYIDADDPDRWLTQKALCAWLDISERTVERMRSEGTGPRFSKFGKRILYRLCDVETWLSEHSFHSTIEARLDATQRPKGAKLPFRAE